MAQLILWRRELWLSFWRRRLVVTPVVITVLAVLLNWVLVVSVMPTLGETITLRYSIYFGSNWLVDKIYLLVVPTLALFFAVFNFWLAYKLSRGSIILRVMALWGNVFVTFAAFWLSILLVWYNA